MKKRIVLCLFAAMCFFTANAQQESPNKFTLTGKVTGRDTGLIWLSYVDKSEKDIIDSTYLKNGNFTFTAYISEPTIASIGYASRLFTSDSAKSKLFYIEPATMQITLRENDYQHGVVTGSKTQSEKDTLDKKTAAFIIGRDNIFKAKQSIKETEYAFIVSHPKSYLDPYLMTDPYFRNLSIDSAKFLYNGFDPSIQQSVKGKYINALILARSSTSIGKKSPLFVKKDINGKEISLAAYKGSYVLLDFWASWCVPCRELTPHLKSVYSKYHLKGLDIISIAVNDKEKAWKKAVADDKMVMWPNIFDANDKEDITLKTKYNVGPIPTLILIDKNGNIAGRYVGQGGRDQDDLDIKLDMLFNPLN